MPFQSEKQRRFMWMKHPKIADRWANEYPDQEDLPMRKAKKKGKMAALKKMAKSGKCSDE